MSTVIVVNDEPRILEMVRSLLEEAGHCVRPFAHGPEALVALGGARADLIITDATNHPMSGVEFVRRLRHLADVPVIFLSAWAQEVQEELRGTDFEAQGYIDLPFSTQQLLEDVKTVLTHRPGRK